MEGRKFLHLAALRRLPSNRVCNQDSQYRS
jgi:hypothetical protein